LKKKNAGIEQGKDIDPDSETSKTIDSSISQRFDFFHSNIIPFLKNRITRYTISFIFVAIVVYFYILFEGNREDEFVRVFFFNLQNHRISQLTQVRIDEIYSFFPSSLALKNFKLVLNHDLLVPIALVFALVAVFYVTWDDALFRKFKSPGLYMILLTGIFYILIFSGLDVYLFQLTIAKWLTQATAVIVVALVKLFGMNIINTTWNADDVITTIQFEGPNGLSSIGIDARCSGIHSLTIFIAIFLLMLFEARTRLKWSKYRTFSDLMALLNKNGIDGIFDKQGSKTILILSGTFSLNFLRVIGILFVGMIGTYLVNILRVTIIFIINYYEGWGVAEPIHNYLGYVFLMIWVPIFWLFILPIFEKKKESKKSNNSIREPSDSNSDSTDDIITDSNISLELVESNKNEE
jgi:exosortase/archaeosortase family protein